MSLELLDTAPAVPAASPTVPPGTRPAGPRSPALSRTGVRLVAQTALLGAILAAVGLPALFGTFRFYDDEGYFLVSLRSFAEGSPLYDQVFTQYGPLYYQVEWLLFSALGLPFTSAAARWVVLGTWALTAAVCGIAAFRTTRSFLAAASAQVLGFAVLAVLADEPLHPAVLTCLLVAAAACFLSGPPGPRPIVGRWIAAALLSGALLAIKVNVGVFSAIAIASAAVVFSGGDRPVARYARIAVRLLLPVVPFVLVRHRISEPSVVLHAASVALALALISAELRGRGPAAIVSPRGLAITGCALAAVPAASFATALLLGTSPEGLLRGVLLDPLRWSSAFAVLLDPDPAFAVAALASWALLLLRLRSRCRRPGAGRQPRPGRRHTGRLPRHDRELRGPPAVPAHLRDPALPVALPSRQERGVAGIGDPPLGARAGSRAARAPSLPRRGEPGRVRHVPARATRGLGRPVVGESARPGMARGGRDRRVPGLGRRRARALPRLRLLPGVPCGEGHVGGRGSARPPGDRRASASPSARRRTSAGSPRTSGPTRTCSHQPPVSTACTSGRACGPPPTGTPPSG